jgi:hypothetical protein
VLSSSPPSEFPSQIDWIWGFFLVLFGLQLPVNGELLWDNGTPFPEPCIDRLAPHIGKVVWT